MEGVLDWGAIFWGAEKAAETIGTGISATAAGVLTGVGVGIAIVLWPSSIAEDVNSPEAIERQREYEEAKALSDTPPPPGGNPCSTLSRQIDHAERVIKLYEAWDAKWNPGCHSQKLQDWKQRLQNLKEEHRRRCTQK
jgi:type VI secretion system secreted protein VgrG